jgi:hypothetical protein
MLGGGLAADVIALCCGHEGDPFQAQTGLSGVPSTLLVVSATLGRQRRARIRGGPRNYPRRSVEKLRNAGTGRPIVGQ